MKFSKQKPSSHIDIKSQMIKDYLDPAKGLQFKNIDLKRIELEKEIKHMKISQDRMIVECKNDIA